VAFVDADPATASSKAPGDWRAFGRFHSTPVPSGFLPDLADQLGPRLLGGMGQQRRLDQVADTSRCTEIRMPPR
jgi:hypothetical protein